MLGPGTLFSLIWVGWLVSWFAAAFWTSRTVKSAGRAGDIGSRVMILVGALVFSRLAGGRLHLGRLWHVGLTGAYVLVALTAAGLVFAWWARLHLGRLWSGAIVAKEGHRVVDTGPYGLVRHPIYTGLILSILATGAAKATWAAILGAAIMLAAFWWKARREEEFLAAELGAGDYAAYKARVPMLIPFKPTQ